MQAAGATMQYYFLGEGVFLVGKYKNKTARKVGKRTMMKRFEFASGNINGRVAWNETTDIAVREKLELDTGEQHDWQKEIFKDHEKVRGGNCMDLLYEIDRHFAAAQLPASVDSI